MTVLRDQSGTERVSEPVLLRLHAYYDGELAFFARMILTLRLRRSPALRRELRTLRGLGELAREAEAPDVPDLWTEIAERLPAAGAPAREPARAHSPSPVRRGSVEDSEANGGEPGWLASLWRPLPASLAAAAVAAVVVLGVFISTPGGGPVERTPLSVTGSGTLRYLDTGGKPVMVLQDRANVTIIWIMDAEADTV